MSQWLNYVNYGIREKYKHTKKKSHNCMKTITRLKNKQLVNIMLQLCEHDSQSQE